jgi:hypothetical protein
MRENTRGYRRKTVNLHVELVSDANNKNKIVAHRTDHGNAHFGPTQQPTNNTAALV